MCEGEGGEGRKEGPGRRAWAREARGETSGRAWGLHGAAGAPSTHSLSNPRGALPCPAPFSPPAPLWNREVAVPLAQECSRES